MRETRGTVVVECPVERSSMRKHTVAHFIG